MLTGVLIFGLYNGLILQENFGKTYMVDDNGVMFYGNIQVNNLNRMSMIESQAQKLILGMK